MANEGSTKPTELEFELRYIADSPTEDHGGFHPRVVKAAQDALAELLRVRGLLQRQWISVEERLPEQRVRVLAWVVVPPDCLGHFIGWMNSRGQWIDPIGEFKSDSVTHWMPLPVPPNSETKSACRCVELNWDIHHPHCPLFPVVPSGAESADIGKLDTADKSGVEMGKVNMVDELPYVKLEWTQEEIENFRKLTTGEMPAGAKSIENWLAESSLGSPPPTSDSSAPTSPTPLSTQLDTAKEKV